MLGSEAFSVPLRGEYREGRVGGSGAEGQEKWTQTVRDMLGRGLWHLQQADTGGRGQDAGS